MKKLITMIICLIMVSVIMTACSSSNETQSKDKTTSYDSKTTPNSPAKDSVNLTAKQQEEASKTTEVTDSKKVPESTQNDSGKTVNQEKDAKTKDSKYLESLLTALKNVIDREKTGVYANEALEESPEDVASMLDLGFCRNPRGVEWMCMSSDIELYLLSPNTTFGEDLHAEYNKYYKDDKAAQSGEDNIRKTLDWLRTKIIELEGLIN